MISRGADHTAGRRLDYVGSLETILEEVDTLENTAVVAKPRYHMRARRVSKDGPTLTDDEARGVCRVYLADVCCIDRAFRDRCERVGVHCPAHVARKRFSFQFFHVARQCRRAGNRVGVAALLEHGRGVPAVSMARASTPAPPVVMIIIIRSHSSDVESIAAQDISTSQFTSPCFIDPLRVRH